MAVAYGSAAAALPGTNIPHPENVDAGAVTVARLDLRAVGPEARTARP